VKNAGAYLILLVDGGITMIIKERQLIRSKQLLSGKIYNENLSILRQSPRRKCSCYRKL